MTPEAERRVNQAIADAAGRIDGYLQGRYSIPLQPVPQLIRSLCVDIAVYNLFARRGFDEESADKAVVTRYRDAIRLLEQIAAGKVRIGANQPAPSHTVLFAQRPKAMRDGLDLF
jgi:phage gp36-like protein